MVLFSVRTRHIVFFLRDLHGLLITWSRDIFKRYPLACESLYQCSNDFKRVINVST